MRILMPKLAGAGMLTLGFLVGGACSSEAVVWLDHKMFATGEWAGGNPIDGYGSYWASDTVNTASPTHYIQSVGVPLSVQFWIDDNVVDNPWPSADILYQKFAGLYSAGGDTSTHDFRFTRTDEMVFSTLGCTLIKIDHITQMGPFSSIVVEQGTYSGGVFTPTSQVMDFITTSSVAVGAGTYRFKSVFDSGTFSSNASFYLANNLSLVFASEAVPEPATMLALALPIVGLIARRREQVR